MAELSASLTVCADQHESRRHQGLTMEPPPSSEEASRLCADPSNRGALRATRAKGEEARALRETSLEAGELERWDDAGRKTAVESLDRAVREAMIRITKA